LGVVSHLAFGVFFFASRRRHTRFSRDWSSDVCSSDLLEGTLDDVVLGALAADLAGRDVEEENLEAGVGEVGSDLAAHDAGAEDRSEERRVGKEGSARGGTDAGTRSQQGNTRLINQPLP